MAWIIGVVPGRTGSLSSWGLLASVKRGVHAPELGPQFAPGELGLGGALIIGQVRGIEDDRDPAAAQRRDAAPERRVAGQGHVRPRHRDDWQAEADRLVEQA